MSLNVLDMVFKIETEGGIFLNPTSIKIGTKKQLDDSSTEPSSHHFPYKTEALVGLSLLKLAHHYPFKSGFFQVNSNFVNLAWRSLDPHFELYWKTQSRLKDLADQSSTLEATRIEDFEKSFDDILQKSIQSWGLNLQDLKALVEKISGFEDRLNSPLLFDFSIKFSIQFIEKLHTLYSLLFHLRSLIALEHNSVTEDTSHHSVRVDSISDYLNGAEFIASGAAFYWAFKKQTRPFRDYKGSDPKIETLLIGPLQKSFEAYLHQSYCLIENTPQKFLGNLKQIRIDEDLYRLQMDWLLGAPSGILYRVREELFALVKGYENLFWSDTTHQNPRSGKELSYTFQLNENELFKLNQNVG